MRRLDQLLSNLGYGSRREVRAWIEAGRATVTGRVVDDPGAKVQPSDVRFDGEALDHPDEILLMLNKPAGLVCSRDPREGPNVYDLLPARWQRRNPAITTVGRLDKDTTGLLLLTDRATLVHRLTSPKHKVPKLYLATVDRDLTPDLPARFAAGGIQLKGEDEACLPAELTIIEPRRAQLIIMEGRYHQVRRMFASQGFEVTALHRERFGHAVLTDLAPGTWRELPIEFFD